MSPAASRGSCAFLLIGALCARPAWSQTSPSAKVDALLGATEFSGASLSPLSAVAAPDAPTSLRPAVESDAVPFVPLELWTEMPPPAPADREFLARRAPDVDLDSVRVLTPEAAEAMFSEASAKRLYPLDLFTDEGFRANVVYLIPQETLATIFGRYAVRVLTPPSGTDRNGKPFTMQALLIGHGRIDALYDRGDFSFDNPFFKDGRYTLSSRVVERIKGPGDLSIEGVSINVPIMFGITKSVVIRRISKISDTENRVDTSMGTYVRKVADAPIAPSRS